MRQRWIPVLVLFLAAALLGQRIVNITGGATASAGSTITEGTYAGLASVTDMQAGDVYRFSDSGEGTPYTDARYNGSSWDFYYLNYKCTPMVIGDYTPDAGVSDTLANWGGAAVLTIPNDGGDRLRATLKALPAAPYTITMLAIVPGAAGLTLHQNATNEFHYLNFLPNNTTSTWRARQFTAPTTASTTYVTAALAGGAYNPVAFFRIADNSTNRITSFAPFGLPWRQLHSIGNTDFLTPDLFGVASSNSYGYTQYMVILSMEIE